MPNLNWKLIAEITGGVLFAVLLVWFFFFRSHETLTPAQTAQQQTFNATSGTSAATGQTDEEASNIASSLQSPISKQKIFKVTDGPVAGATLMQDLRPTTTIARFALQQSGHVLDVALDSPGAVARATSNTTIPGVAQVTWEMQVSAARTTAAGAVLQYDYNGVIKSVLLSFPQASTTATSTVPQPVRIQFLPDNIRGIAASPDGMSLAYMVQTAQGSDGYISRADGINAKKAFSLPLSQLVLSWPSVGTILATSKAAAGVPGVALSVNPTTGAYAPLLYAAGLTTTADRTFTKLLYQFGGRTYAHDNKSGLDRPLSFDPIPEKCVWSRAQDDVLYCALPLSYVGPGYLDLWHMGTASASDSLVSYNLITGKTDIIATPGSQDGGVASDIAELSVSPDDKYLLFVKKGDRSLWGVRLY